MEIFRKELGRGGKAILLGVTGGIASGKTVVAAMLEDLGAVLIDLDVIAREVVLPGKPAWREIVAFFGKAFLLEDGTLDRKKLSRAVFQDPEKREELEGFTHPYIFEELRNQVHNVTAKDPIIEVVVPLLIEKNLQSSFDKILVVYVPPKLQMKRLMERDGISEEEAANMLKAQLPIDEKVSHGDFVVHNGGSMGDTRREVEEIWAALKKLQGEEKK
jgi:dephospho-CoA kinase